MENQHKKHISYVFSPAQMCTHNLAQHGAKWNFKGLSKSFSKQSEDQLCVLSILEAQNAIMSDRILIQAQS